MPSSTFSPSRPSASIGLLVIIALLLAVRRSSAQEGVLLGIGGRYEFGLPLSIRHDPGAINGHAEFDGNGTSYNHTGWMGWSLTAPSLFGQKWGLSGDLGLTASAGQFTSNPFTTEPELDSAHLRLYRSTHILSISSRTTDLLGELALRYQPGRFAFSFGPWLGYRIASTFIGKDSITAVGNGPASLVGTAQSISQEQIAGNQVRWGVLLSTAYQFSAGPFMLQWDITGRADAGALDLGIGAMSIGSGLTLMLGIHPPADSAQTTPPVTPPHPPRLAAHVDIYSDDGSAKAVVHRKDIFHRAVVPLVPTIFFDSSSTSIAQRYRQLTREETRAFTLDSLAGLDAAGIYYQTLNVIGLRMRDNPKATIGLVGASSPKENAAAAQARAEAIRSYLGDIWGIAPGRIEITAERVPESAPRSVRVLTSGTEIARPIAVEWLGRDLTAPSIGVDQQIEAEAGVREWTVTITQGDKQIGHYTSTDRRKMDGLSLSFLLDADRDAPLPPLVAELRVIDSTGATIAAHDTLPITWTGDSLTNIDDENAAEDLLQYLFFYPGEGQAADAAAQASRTIGGIVKNDASITVTIPPPSAEMSSRERNWGVALAGRMLTDLQAKGISVDRFEIATSAGPPDQLPEEEILSQGVSVVVEQDRPNKSGSGQ